MAKRPLRDVLIRVGYAALGAVYVTLGALAFLIAFDGGRIRARGFGAAFRMLLLHPQGPTILMGIAAGLAAFTVARILDAADAGRSFFVRIVAFFDGIGHALMGWLAVRLLIHRRGVGARPALAWLLSQSWGPRALEIAGAVVMVIGAVQVWQGISGRLPQRLPRERLRGATAAAVRIGRVGYAVRGVVSGIVGWFLIRTARDVDPKAYRDIGGALEVIEKMRYGVPLLALAGAGLVAYGGYLLLLGIFQARIK
ncbi:MAG: DUF1206 domain-containing protein [Acidobacteriota bacterium]|nr:DUF1206 domain-containing protein [Acidobacteriota bacterium]